MREIFTGIIISVVVHVFVVLPLAVASFNRNGKTQVHAIEVDFSLVKDTSDGQKTQMFKAGGDLKFNKVEKVRGASKKADKPVQAEHIKPETVPAKQEGKPPSVQTVVSASDARGDMVVHGVPASYASSSGSSRFIVSHSGLAEGTDRGIGQGGSGEKEGYGIKSEDYSFIRDAIMKNIKYPDKARRLGFEGRVLISFMVLENGKIDDVRVIGSSGHQILDESAKNAAAETQIGRKMPHKVAVRLPVMYRLQH